MPIRDGPFEILTKSYNFGDVIGGSFSYAKKRLALTHTTRKSMKMVPIDSVLHGNLNDIYLNRFC